MIEPTSTGPMKHIMWTEPGERTRAKQLAMYEVDKDYHESWMNFMGELVAAGLTDEEFTVKRMDTLSRTQKERKRLQHNIHYRYDIRRRNPELVDRDVKKQLERARIMLTKMREHMAAVAEVEALAIEPTPPPPAPRPARPARPQEPAIRDLSHLDEATLGMIQTDLQEVDGSVDLARATDAEIVDMYATRKVPREAAEYYVGLLNGTIPGPA